MKSNEVVTQKLLEAFAQFRKLHTKQPPIQGLTPGEMHLMFRIGKETKPGEPGIKVSELSNLLRVAPPSITQMINSLESGGYVERTMDKSDRRAVRVNLTDKGQETSLRAKKEFNGLLSGLVEYLGEEKSNQLADLMQEVYNYFLQRKDANP